MSKRNRERRIHSYIDTVPYDPSLVFSRDALAIEPIGDTPTPFFPIGYNELLRLSRHLPIMSRDEFESA